MVNKKLLKTLLFCLTSLLLIAYLVVATKWSRSLGDSRKCERVDVIVNDSAKMQFVTVQEILREIHDFPSRATSVKLSDLNTDSLERLLSQVDKIEKVSCVTLTDNTMRIMIDPLCPVARVFDGNLSYYINREGKRMSATERYHLDVPVIAGRFDHRFKAADLLPLVDFIEGDQVWRSLITMIKVDSPHDVILIPSIRGHVINIGDVDNFKDKFHRVLRAYKEIMPVKGWDFYDTISVKWGGQIVATKRVKALPEMISPDDLDAEKEMPDEGTMLVEDSIGVGNGTDKLRYN